MSDDANETPEAEADETVDIDEAAEVDAAAESATAAGAGDEIVAEAKADTGTKTDAGTKTDPAKADRKAKADAAVADRQAPVRRTVTSRRVTPKGGAKVEAPATTSKARDAKKTESVVSRAPVATPQQVYAKGPSPWYVPAIMFGLLAIGALIIMSNYMGVFGTASNIRLVIGLGFILGGIVTATQYR